MSRRQGSITERSPGRWLVRYSSQEASGRRRFVVTVKGARRDAERELRERLKALDDNAHVDPTKTTVRDYLTEWLATVRAEVSPATHVLYSDHVLHHLIPALGGALLAKLAELDIQRVYSAWATSGRRDGKAGGISPTTRRRLHRVLHTALARAVELRLIARNPAAIFKKRLVKLERRELTVLAVGEGALLLEAIRKHRVYWPVLLALATGARRGEILALRWRHVDLERGVATIAESLEFTPQGGLRFKPPKSGKPRAVTLPEFAVEELQRRRREQAEELLRLGVRRDGDTLVCARADGEPMRPTSLTHEFSKIVGKVEGVPRLRFHDLRHSHATTLLANGVPLKVVSERLGHASISITADTYQHVTAAMQEDAAQKLDAAFRDISRPR